MSELIISVSGVRGVVGDSLLPQTACELAMAFASPIAERSAVVVARDSRPSGRMLEQAVTAGLLACGLTARPLGVVATPTAALAVADLGCAGGVMITASHNPGPWNGLKFMGSDGQCLSAAHMAALADRLRVRQFRLVGHDGRFAVEPDAESSRRHVERVLACVDRAAIRGRGLPVLLDSVNGAGGVAGRYLLESLGCSRALLEHVEPTGEFPRTPEPTAEHVTDVCRRVADSGVAVGFVQDPDADRLALIDETGRYIGEEYTLVLAARSAIAAGRVGPVAANLSTSRMIDDVAAAAGVHVFRTAVGEANVAAAVAEHGCILGGEGNGGVIEPRVVPVRDSISGMALVLDLLARDGRALSRIVADLPRYHMVKKKFPLPPGGVAPLLARVGAAGRGGIINDADGVRIDWPEGWVHVRASNTEPAYRVIAEGRDAADTARILRHIQSAVAGG